MSHAPNGPSSAGGGAFAAGSALPDSAGLAAVSFDSFFLQPATAATTSTTSMRDFMRAVISQRRRARAAEAVAERQRNRDADTTTTATCTGIVEHRATGAA